MKSVEPCFVGPFAGTRFNREALVKALLEHFKSARQISPEYNRVYSEYKKLSDDQLGDPEEVQKIMNSLYSNVVSKHLAPLTKMLDSFFVK
jgi:hypothetical protein